jgi:DNA-binding XRE family transcriptional regulator
MSDTERALLYFKERREVITYKAVAAFIGVGTSRLRKHTDAYHLVKEAIHAQRDGEPENLQIETRDAIEMLKKHGKRLTHKRIGEAVGVSAPTLRKNKGAHALVKAAISAQKKQDLVQLEIDTHQAIETLERAALRITYQSVAEVIGVSTGTLRNHPKAAGLVNDALQAQKDRDIVQLERATRHAIKSLRNRAEPVTQEAVAEIIEVNRYTLRRRRTPYQLVQTAMNLQKQYDRAKRSHRAVSSDARTSLEKLKRNRDHDGHEFTADLIETYLSRLQKLFDTC